MILLDMNKNTFSWLCVRPKPRIKVLTCSLLFRVFAFALLPIIGVMPSCGQEGSCVVSRTYTSPDEASYIEHREYDNGLGDIVEKVDVGVTPDRKNLVSLVEYDAYRRVFAHWLPVKTFTAYTVPSTIKSSSGSQYGDTRAWEKSDYDPLLYGEVAGMTKAGSEWHTSGKKVLIEHSMAGSVVNFRVTDNGTVNINGLQSCVSDKTTDEDGVWHFEIKDYAGRLKMVKDAGGYTYYCYNCRSDLCYVLPAPSSYTAIAEYYSNHKNTLSESDSHIQKYAYIYKYDDAHRCTYKKLPGCEPIYYIYDAAGNCILSQDGVQRSRGEWMFTIPDKFGRPSLKGICKNSYSYSSEPLHGVFVYASPSASSNYGYSISGMTLSSPAFHEIFYYDNYSFIGKNGVPTSLSYSSPPSGFPSRDANAGRGLLTGRTVAYGDDTGINGSVHTAYYYDYCRRVVQSRSTNAKGGSDIVYTLYTFTGKPLKVRSNHSSEAVSDLQELTEYSYDYAERLLTVDHTIGSGGKRRLLHNTYDTFGRLSACQRFGKTSLNTQYGYNIQSSLKSLSTGNLFRETLYYQESYNGSTPKYNGRQDGGTWGKVNQLTYSYDGNQLTKVSDNVSSPTYNGFFGFIDGADQTTGYEYDANGNMTKDRNKGISCIIYNTMNLPSRIEYENGSRATYLYSADGTKLQVKYETSYAGLLASGPPTSSAPTAIAETHTIDYVGNKIYEDGELSRILIEGGYVDYSGGTPIYHAYLTDHQGNVRVVVDENATVKQVNHYYPYGALFAESTNGGVQPYKYNGKELDRMHGLDWYDHGARHNDAAIGRWHVMDPLCEKYYDVSPYAYCAGDPVGRIDYDGKDTVNISNVNGKWIFDKPIMAKGDDVFNVTVDGTTRTFTFSEGEYGERVNALNLDITENYTLGVYHISGAKDGGTGYFVTPGGEASTKVNSGARIPEGEYPINAPKGNERWRKPGVGGDVAPRGIRFHYDVANGFPSKSTEGCFVLSYSYKVKNGQIHFPNRADSRIASRNFDRLLGGSCHYNYYYRYMREGTTFLAPITTKLILKTR